MKLAGSIYEAIREAIDKGVDTGKTTVQKIMYFSLPEEKRKQMYIAYHFGPFSRDVQMVTEGLVANGYVSPEPRGWRFKIDKKVPKERIKAEPEILDRISKTLSFLTEKNITSTKKIALLSKVYYFKNNKPTEVQDFVSFVKEKSRHYGWDELVRATPQQIETNLALIEELEERLNDLGHAQAH